MFGRAAEDGERGQVSIALVAAIPILILVVLGIVQLLLAGHAAIAASHAARAAARASYVGSDPRAAARAALPDGLRAGAEVDSPSPSGRSASGAVRVEVDAPRAFPGIPPLPIAASARVGPEGGGGG